MDPALADKEPFILQKLSGCICLETFITQKGRIWRRTKDLAAAQPATEDYDPIYNQDRGSILGRISEFSKSGSDFIVGVIRILFFHLIQHQNLSSFDRLDTFFNNWIRIHFDRELDPDP